MIHFILNHEDVHTDMPGGMLLIDFIRYHRHLKGTKIGCREGDCGACVVLVGQLTGSAMQYRSFTSCLTPLGNIQGRHVVTIEGINGIGLNPIQQAMSDHSATQCGFCTPGIVMSLAGFCLSAQQATPARATAAVDGNICRCTGYKSIERAAGTIADMMRAREGEEPVSFATGKQVLPAYFNAIAARLQALHAQCRQPAEHKTDACWVGGGTDLYVQKHEAMKHASIRFLNDREEWKTIWQQGNICRIGASATVTDVSESAVMQEYFPGLQKYMKLVSSTPVRNMATLSGNFINASPIGDLTIFFLALDATVVLSDGNHSRELPLRHLYKGYKTLDKTPVEYIEQIKFTLPGSHTLFNFEKVSKRTHLDIASVNSAMRITVHNQVITDVHLSAGGVGPVPLYLQKTVSLLTGRALNEALVCEAVAMAQTEIAPISDVRGSAAYKTLLLAQLVKAHFLTLFPELQVNEVLT